MFTITYGSSQEDALSCHDGLAFVHEQNTVVYIPWHQRGSAIIFGRQVAIFLNRRSFESNPKFPKQF
jgi:hypothetical protein